MFTSVLILQKSKLYTSVQLLNHVRLFPNPWIAAHQASLSISCFQTLYLATNTSSISTVSDFCPIFKYFQGI